MKSVFWATIVPSKIAKTVEWGEMLRTASSLPQTVAYIRTQAKRPMHAVTLTAVMFSVWGGERLTSSLYASATVCMI